MDSLFLVLAHLCKVELCTIFPNFNLLLIFIYGRVADVAVSRLTWIPLDFLGSDKNFYVHDASRDITNSFCPVFLKNGRSKEVWLQSYM